MGHISRTPRYPIEVQYLAYSKRWQAPSAFQTDYPERYFLFILEPFPWKVIPISVRGECWYFLVVESNRCRALWRSVLPLRYSAEGLSTSEATSGHYSFTWYEALLQAPPAPASTASTGQASTEGSVDSSGFEKVRARWIWVVTPLSDVFRQLRQAASRWTMTCLRSTVSSLWTKCSRRCSASRRTRPMLQWVWESMLFSIFWKIPFNFCVFFSYGFVYLPWAPSSMAVILVRHLELEILQNASPSRPSSSLSFSILVDIC